MLNEKRNITLISNITLEPYFVPSMMELFGKEYNYNVIQYGEQRDEHSCDILRNSELLMIWMNFEFLFPRFTDQYLTKEIDDTYVNDVVDLCKFLLFELPLKAECKVMWVLFEDMYNKLTNLLGNVPFCNSVIDRINISLQDELKACRDITFIDLKYSIAQIGIGDSYDTKSKYRWNAPYSKMLISSMVEVIYKQYQIYLGITKKCLILDCDNVLWGGILSEDGMVDIKLANFGLGREYYDFQLFVLNLFYKGVILAISSKNDIDDVINVFRNHPEMILKEENIACFRANWHNKSDNIRAIADTLNIDLKSMVFVDDSINEIEEVKATLPEVTAILYDRTTVYEQLACFNLKENVDVLDVMNRNETYRTNGMRAQLELDCSSFDEYIKSLKMEVSIEKSSEMDLPRISELSQRANKCTNGRRYTLNQLKEKTSENYQLYSVYVLDRFSNLGLVGAIGIENNILDLFVLSCRALGRNVENIMMDYIKKNKIINFYKASTNKNEVLLNELDKFFDDELK